MPVALKAAFVNGQVAPDDPEGRLLRAIGRSKPAPQGICVADASGRPLVWTLGFDDEEGILAFLDHAKERFAASLDDPSKRLPVERYRSFPGHKLADFADDAAAPEVPAGHGTAPCPARPRAPRGTLVARVVGRALDAKGEPVADTKNQESYVEDRFLIATDAQAALGSAVASGAGRVKVPGELARVLVGHAYLGMLDASPGEVQAELFAERAGEGYRLVGKSRASSRTDGRPSDGAKFEHSIELAWTGWVELRDSRVVRLLLEARGRERLRWVGHRAGANDLTELMSGRPIDFEGGVRYGITAEPIAESDVGPEGTPLGPDGGAPPRVQALQRKVERVQAGIARWQDAGRDPTPVGKILERFEPFLNAGQIDEAEAVIDRALALLEGTTDTPPGPSAPGPDERTKGVRQRLERVHQKVAALVREGKIAEAEAALDRALAALDEPARR